MKKYILTLFALIFAFSAANAQEFTISGTVTDTEDEPLAGVAVIIQETKEGTMTDGKGRYTIEAEEGQTLVHRHGNPECHHRKKICHRYPDDGKRHLP